MSTLLPAGRPPVPAQSRSGFGDQGLGRPAAGAAPEHVAGVDGLRALAAIYVTLHHIWLQVWPPEYGAAPQGWALRLTGWLFYGHFAVALFLVLSGYCLMIPVLRQGGLRGGVPAFLRRRARRILPPYYLAMALALLLIATCIGHKTHTHWDASLPVTPAGLLARLLLLQDWTGDGQINHVFWSIAAEWHIYFLFPLLLWGWKRFGPLPTTLAALLAGMAVVCEEWRFPAASGWNPQFVGLFALGMLAATLGFSQEPRWQALRRRVPWGTASAGLFVALAAICLHRGLVDPRLATLDPLGGLCALALLVALSRPGGGRLGAALSWRPLVWVGGFSYSLYLVHAPLIQVLWQYGVSPRHLAAAPSFVLLAIVGLPLIVGLAWLFSLAGEKPFLRRRADTPALQTDSTSPATPGRRSLIDA